MNQEIKFYTKSVYGQEKIYAADPEQAEAIRKITGRVTLTFGDMQGMRDLGFYFTEVNRPLQEKGIPATMYHIFDRV